MSDAHSWTTGAPVSQPAPSVPPAEASAPAASPTSPGSPTLSYATPTQYDTATVWRDGGKLMTTTSAALPPQCVKCAAPADGFYGPRTFSWYHPLLILLILVNILIFAIVALIVRKKAVVQVGLCAAHRASRTRAIVWAWVLGLPAVPVIIAGVIAADELDMDWLAPAGLLSGLGMLLAAIIIGMAWGRILVPTKINARFAWFKGAGNDFLALFPPAR